MRILDECTELTAQQRDLQLMVRDFATEPMGPAIAEAEASESYPRRLLEEMAELGLFGGVVPAEYGGLGLDHVSYSIVLEEMARVDHVAAVLSTQA
jgi:hypothetical protein